MSKKFIPLIAGVLAATSCMVTRQQKQGHEVHITGAMKNVMWKGQLSGNIYLDTIANKQHLYGLGPVEYLGGELLIIDGIAYQSTVVTDSTMKVETTYKVKAPFFGHANIPKWEEQFLPDSIQTLGQLERYLDNISKTMARPFIFKLSGMVKQAGIHIVNLPKGTIVSSPEDAHKGQVSYTIKNVPVDMVGFFSTEHQSIFTHHDTYLHIHLITADRQNMGHLDETLMEKGMKLYLPGK